MRCRPEACTTARQIWARLELEYAEKGVANRESLLTEFYTTKMDPRKSICEYVSEIEELAMNLAEFGHNLDDETIMVKIATGLPQPEYSGFKRTWDLTPASSKTRALLLQSLKTEEKALSVTHNGGEALISQTTPSKSE